MTTIQRTQAHLLIVALLVLGACAKQPDTGTPGTPTPPQIKITKDMRVLKDALNTAQTALEAARANGSMTAADVVFVQNKILLPMARVGLAIDAEVVSSDDWPTMRAKILAVIANAGLSGLSANLPPNAQSLLAIVITTWNSIASSVGGPAI